MPISDRNSINQPFIQKIRQTIEDCRMLQKGDSVLVGVSGGADSMALLHGLMILSDGLDLRLGVAHLNHCLRHAESDRDENFVMSVARRLGLPFFIEKKDILLEREKSGLSLEEAGREARYLFFYAVCRNSRFDKIAVGHHQDDNAELILLNLLRGSGPAGIGGIPPVRNNIVRPLIRSSRAEIVQFLASQKIDHVCDASNTDETFLRNKIRHRLIPMLKNAYNPKISEALNRMGNILQSEEEWINGLLDPLYDQAVLNADSRNVTLSMSELLNFHPAAQHRVLRKAILSVKGNLKKISWSHIDAIASLIKNQMPDARLDLPDRIRIARQSDQILIARKTGSLRGPEPDIPNPVGFEYLIPHSAAESRIPVFISETNTCIRFTKTDRSHLQNLSGHGDNVAFFDWDRLQFPLIIRNGRTGDRFSPMGMRGTQKLKKFFIDHKVATAKRAAVPIVVSGDSIIWVGGFRISERVKISSDTRTVLQAEIFTKIENR